MKTPTKTELQEYLNNIKHNFPVYISCGFNRYIIKRIFLTENYILLDVGDVDNSDEPTTEEYDDGPMVA